MGKEARKQVVVSLENRVAVEMGRCRLAQGRERPSSGLSALIKILWDLWGVNAGQTVPSGSAALTQLWQPCWGSWRVKEQLFPGDLGCAWDVGSAGKANRLWLGLGAWT